MPTDPLTPHNADSLAAQLQHEFEQFDKRVRSSIIMELPDELAPLLAPSTATPGASVHGADMVFRWRRGGFAVPNAEILSAALSAFAAVSAAPTGLSDAGPFLASLFKSVYELKRRMIELTLPQVLVLTCIKRNRRAAVTDIQEQLSSAQPELGDRAQLESLLAALEQLGVVRKDGAEHWVVVGV